MSTNASPARNYILTGVGLLGLLALTIAAAYLNLGVLNPIITASISVASTALILLFYSTCMSAVSSHCSGFSSARVSFD